MKTDQSQMTNEQQKKSTQVSASELIFLVEDNGGRRLGFRKRAFSYDAHIPERRSGSERRSGTDRRETVVSQIYSKDRRGIEGRLGS